MSEEVLIQMSQQLGELTGVVKTSMASQAETNTALFTMVKDHEERLKSTEALKNKLIGAAALSTVGGTGIAATLLKLFHGG